VDAVLLVFTVANFVGPFRVTLGLIFGLFIPGWSIVGLLRLSNPALEFGITVATSLSVLMLTAQSALTLHKWHLFALQIILEIACLPPLLWQSSIHLRFAKGRT